MWHSSGALPLHSTWLDPESLNWNFACSPCVYVCFIWVLAAPKNMLVGGLSTLDNLDMVCVCVCVGRGVSL